MDLIYATGLAEAFPIHRIEPLAILLYALATFLFLLYYLWRYLHKGIFSFDSYFVVMSLYVPIVFMFPFAFSEINSLVATGHFHHVYVPYLHEAFYISLFGIAFFVVGGIVARFSGVKLFGLTTIGNTLRAFWLTRLGIALSVGFIFLLLFMMVGLGFEIGNARATAMERPGLRPLYNLFHVLAPFVALNIFVCGYKRSARGYYLLGSLVALAGLFGGTRGASIGVFISLAVILIISTRYRSFFLPTLALALALVAAVYIGGMRHGVYDLSQLQAVPVLLLYGNNFSDLRDFAWILSGWDGVFLQGRTQLAGLLSFIPSSLFDFRSAWSWGHFSTVTAGLEEVSGHPGLRPPLFGEFFFNFGLPGVALSGFLTGFVVFKLSRYVDRHVVHDGARGASVHVLAAMVYLTLFLSFLMTAGFFAFHLIIMMVLLAELLIQAARRHRSIPA